MMSSNIKNHFKTQKNAIVEHKTRSRARDQDVAPQALASARSVGDAATQDLDVDGDERLLRGFDLELKFGPCTGMTRMERWERAHKFGLSPPPAVRDLLLAKGLDSSANRNLWHGRI